MIALGKSRRARGAFPDGDVGMLDVSANALAVLILATMMVLTVAAPPAPRGETRAADRPPLFYPSPLDVAVAPQSAYWIVTSGGLTALDINAFVAGLGDQSPVSRTEQGEATLIIDRSRYRDLNDHRLHVLLKWTAIRDTAQALDTEEARQAAQQEIRSAFERDGIAPTFVVLAEDTEVFAPLYWTLRENQVPMRWVSIVEGGALTLSRQVSNFDERQRQWQ